MLINGILALALAIQAKTQPQAAIPSPPQSQETIPPVPNVGTYMPNSQLLTWCKDDRQPTYAFCISFVQGIYNAAGSTATKWPKGWISVPPGTPPNKLVTEVIAYMGHLPPEQMSAPASDSVYDALVAIYPYTPTNEKSVK